MIKAVITIGTAAVLAGLVTVLPALQVEAGTSRPETVAPAGAAAQSASLPQDARKSACSQRAWPYYGQDCLTDFDARWRGEPRSVRLVTTDRLN